MVSDGGRWSFPSHLDAISQGRRCGRDLLLFTNRHIKTHVVHCTADGGRCRTCESEGKTRDFIAIGPHSQSCASTVALPHSQHHTLPFPSALPPSLTHTHSLSLLQCFSTTHSAALARVISPLWSAERGDSARGLTGSCWTGQTETELRTWGTGQYCLRGGIPSGEIQRKITSSGDYLHHKTCGKSTVTLSV